MEKAVRTLNLQIGDTWTMLWVDGVSEKKCRECSLTSADLAIGWEWNRKGREQNTSQSDGDYTDLWCAPCLIEYLRRGIKEGFIHLRFPPFITIAMWKCGLS